MRGKLGVENWTSLSVAWRSIAAVSTTSRGRHCLRWSFGCAETKDRHCLLERTSPQVCDDARPCWTSSKGPAVLRSPPLPYHELSLTLTPAALDRRVHCFDAAGPAAPTTCAHWKTRACANLQKQNPAAQGRIPQTVFEAKKANASALGANNRTARESSGLAHCGRRSTALLHRLRLPQRPSDAPHDPVSVSDRDPENAAWSACSPEWCVALTGPPASAVLNTGGR